jgi:hypothetical protein
MILFKNIISSDGDTVGNVEKFSIMILIWEIINVEEYDNVAAEE